MVICSGSGTVEGICIKRNINTPPIWLHKCKLVTNPEEYERIRRCNAIITPVNISPI